VNAVVEINEIRQTMDFYPLYGFVRAIALTHKFQVWRIIEQHGVAIHAGFRWRDASDGWLFHAGMTIPAVDPIVAYMVLVTELHWLFARNILPRQVRRPCHTKYRGQRDAAKKQRRKYAESRDKIRTSMKNLSHIS
jgi:ATP/ADP translocase